MKFTLSWLKEHLDTKASLDDITSTLTAIGLEVEQVVDNSEALAPFIVAEVLEAEKHPNADKLKLCKVSNGKEELQIVCGAPNAHAGMKAVLAPVGTLIPNGQFKIKKSKIRDVESNGMLCSAAELNLGEDTAGIIELPNDAEIGEPAAKWLGADDPMIEIAITPNRGDCLGVYGIARDLAAAGLGTLNELTIEQMVGSFDSPINVTIDNKDKTPTFIGRYIKEVKNGPSPEWLRKRLESIGLKSISTLVDITNFLTHDLGRPAHVYDADTLKGDLVVRDSTQGEQLDALDEKTYTLDTDMTVIADQSGPVALGGIIGGTATGCTEETVNVFLEIALFNPIDVATTGRMLQIDSDARYRFERGVDPAFAMDGAHYATELIMELCGGEASTPIIAGAIPYWQKNIAFDVNSIEAKIGITPSAKEVKNILVALGFDVHQENDQWDVSVPTWRGDVRIAEDLVEEITRIYGYDNIPAITMPKNTQTLPTFTVKQHVLSDVRRTLAMRGMKEVVNFSFISSEQSKIFAASNDNMCLDNPISSELDAMRPNILPGLIEALGRNQARNIDQVALFEIGPVFTEITPGGQHIVAAGIRVGDAITKHTQGERRLVDLFDAKADALAALRFYVDPNKLHISREVPTYYHPGRSGALLLGKKILGYFGEIHPKICQQMGIKNTVVGFEIFPENAPEPKAQRSTARPKLALSNYQSVERDFAFIVDESVTAADILKAVRQAEKVLIDSVNLFDVYQGKGVEEGKKSIALSIRLQPTDKTLTDEEIEAVSNAVITNVEKAVGGVLRG